MATQLALIRRDLAETRQLAGAVLAYGAEKDLPLWRPANHLRLGYCDLLETGDVGPIDAMRELADSFRPSGNLMVSPTYGTLADACLRVGRIDEAAEAIEAAFETRGEERLFDAELLRLRAMILAARMETSAAPNNSRQEVEQTLEQAIASASRSGAHLFALRATVDLCRLWLSAGEREPARQRLSQALGSFDEGFDQADLRQAKDLLDALNSRNPIANET